MDAPRYHKALPKAKRGISTADLGMHGAGRAGFQPCARQGGG